MVFVIILQDKLRRSRFFITDCSYFTTVEQSLKEQGDGIVIDYELVKINDHKSHSFYTVSSLEEFAKMLDTEWAREWDKANNCKDIVYKLELIE